jgi:hypothetical protein
MAGAIPDEAIDYVAREASAMAVREVFDALRADISTQRIRETARKLIESGELRAEVSTQQTFLTLDLYQIQLTNWRDIVASDKEALEELLALRKEEVKSFQVKNELLRKVELAEVQLAKARSEENFDIAMFRFRRVKGHLIVGAILLVVGVFVGQTIEGFNRDRAVPAHKVKVSPKAHKSITHR